MRRDRRIPIHTDLETQESQRASGRAPRGRARLDAPLHVAAGLLVLVATTVLAVPASAGTLSWTGVPLHLWVPPDESGTALADLPPVRHDFFTIFVTQSGLYTLTSGPSPGSDEGLWPGLIALYDGRFDSAAPLDHLIALDHYDATPAPAARIDAHLIAGVVYYVVTSHAAEDLGPVDYTNRLTGPGEIRRNACFPVGDETDNVDGDVEGFALQEERFCALADWATTQGTAGIARRVPFRSDDSVLFWFFAPGNWELQVKILDGCAVNGHFWVFFAATTNVEFELRVFGRGNNFANPALRKTYRNPQGRRADAVTDTEAFPCSEVVDQV